MAPLKALSITSIQILTDCQTVLYVIQIVMVKQLINDLTDLLQAILWKIIDISEINGTIYLKELWAY